MAKFQIGNIVKVMDGALQGNTCVVIGYAGETSYGNEQLYHLRYYGGGPIDIPVKESYLDSHEVF